MNHRNPLFRSAGFDGCPFELSVDPSILLVLVLLVRSHLAHRSPMRISHLRYGPHPPRYPFQVCPRRFLCEFRSSGTLVLTLMVLIGTGQQEVLENRVIQSWAQVPFFLILANAQVGTYINKIKTISKCRCHQKPLLLVVIPIIHTQHGSQNDPNMTLKTYHLDMSGETSSRLRAL